MYNLQQKKVPYLKKSVKYNIILTDVVSMPIIQQASGTYLAAYYEVGVGQ